MTKYQLTCINNSSIPGDFCVYQQSPNMTAPDVMSLAWFAQPAAPSTSVTFSWDITYNFVWSQQGNLVPGVTFTASQVWPADPKSATANAVGFTLLPDGAFTFEPAPTPGEAGSLTIFEDGTIPDNEASVGIGMSGSGTFASNAHPNYNQIYTPHPEYWVTFGTFTPGLVLDVESIVNQSAQIEFPDNVYSMTATLNANNTWTITQPLPAQRERAVKAHH